MGDSAAKNSPKYGRISARAALVFGSALFALLLVEAALRVAGYSYPIFYTTDAERGHALRPGMEGWYRKEGGAYVRINADGLRDRERARPKPPGTLRVAVLGDSYAEALQVPFEDSFPALVERALAGCEALAGRAVEVINFGVSGYGTAQELITLRRHVWDYSPDLVVLAVTTNNDITDNSRALKKTDEAPYFIYRGGRLVLDDSFRASPAFRLRQSALNRLGRGVRDSSRVIQALHQAHVALKSLIAARRGAPAPRPPAESPDTLLARSEELGIDNLIYRAPADDTWGEAWRVTEELILLMRDEVRAGGAQFLLVTLSNGIQVHPDPAVRHDFMRRFGIEDMFYPDFRLRDLGEREGIPLLTLAPTLQAYAEHHKVYLHGFGANLGNGHWNQAGHRAAGQLIAGRLCDEFARRGGDGSVGEGVRSGAQ